MQELQDPKRHFPLLPYYLPFFRDLGEYKPGEASHMCVLCQSNLRASDEKGHVHGSALQSHFQHRHPDLLGNIEATREREMQEDAKLSQELDQELVKLKDQAAKEQAAAVDHVRAKLAHDKAEAVIRETLKAAQEKSHAVGLIRAQLAREKAQAVYQEAAKQQ
ncbi:hypothetical protein BASA82_000649 [Batrachochytrium salamandrivorans]|nr:hypothetical protein BASA82_000649 [Batrachochytrium salamandrivorans]